MNTLFPILPVVPPGFLYYPDFITEQEESDTVDAIRKWELKKLNFQGYEAKRKVASFGYDWSFDKRVLTKGKEIPRMFEWISRRVGEQVSHHPQDFSELLLTEYPVGAVINWHRDAPPFDIIAGISLLSDCSFRLRPYEKMKQGKRAIITIPVKRRSLYVMQGESRTDWEHSITPVKELRYSITLRTLR